MLGAFFPTQLKFKIQKTRNLVVDPLTFFGARLTLANPGRKDISAKRASTISAHISPAIDACGSAMWPAALHLFDRMKLFGVTFTASHEGIVKVLGLNWAMSLQVTMHVPDCLADAALYRQALLSCLRSGELMQALRPRRPRGCDHMVLATSEYRICFVMLCS